MDPTLPQPKPSTVPFFDHHQKLIFTTLGIVALLSLTTTLFIISKKNKPLPHILTNIVPTATPTPTPTPMVLPIQTALPTLSATKQHIQTALQQARTELDSAAKVDTTQDTTSGL